MNTGKCPYCGKLVSTAKIEIIEPDTHATTGIYGPLPRGMAFICPNPQCGKILSIVTMTEAAKS
jgi:hypothetical protein